MRDYITPKERLDFEEDKKMNNPTLEQQLLALIKKYKSPLIINECGAGLTIDILFQQKQCGNIINNEVR
jgi:hypothetical protein